MQLWCSGVPLTASWLVPGCDTHCVVFAGGMIASYHRVVRPDVFDSAVAASAPIYYIGGSLTGHSLTRTALCNGGIVWNACLVLAGALCILVKCSTRYYFCFEGVQAWEAAGASRVVAFSTRYDT